MKYWIRVLLSVAITVVAIAACAWALYRLIHTGTCASGGPYVSARPCPAGTGLQIMALIGGVIGMLVGIGLWAVRGDTVPPARKSSLGFTALAFGLLMLALAAAALLAAFGPGATGGDGAKVGGSIAAGVMLMFGLPVLFGGSRRSTIITTPATFQMPTMPTPPTPTPAPPAAPSGDALSRLEKLSELKKSGVLTEAEFEQQKRQILGG